MSAKTTCLLIEPVYKAGDPPPAGYLQWHAWARTQIKAGLRQKRRSCGYWHFPSEVCEHDPKEARL